MPREDEQADWPDWQRLAWLGALAPLLWLQGRHVRRVTPRLPEPPGERVGTHGQGAPLRLLLAGDSAAAGVGAATQQEALSGQLMPLLGRHFTLHWQLHACTGLDSPGLLEALREIPEQPFDVVVLSLGVNDVTGLRAPARWLALQDEVAGLLQRRFAPRLVVHSAVPPMHAFSALPQPLRWYFGRWARQMNRALAGHLAHSASGAGVAGSAQRVLLPLPPGNAGDALAADGFHPGPRGYALWAQALSDCIQAHVRR